MLVSLQMSSFLTWSFMVLPLAHLSILISLAWSHVSLNCVHMQVHVVVVLMLRAHVNFNLVFASGLFVSYIAILIKFGTVDTGKGWHCQLCPCAIRGITTCHKVRHSLSLPIVTYICMRELPHFRHGPTSSFLHSQPIQTHPSGSVPLAKCSFGMIPLLRHSVDLSPRAFHASRRLPTMWYEHLVLRC